MHPVQPPPIKSECIKKEVKRPTSTNKVNHRPPWDNSLFRPKRKPKLKQTVQDLDEIADRKGVKMESVDLCGLGGFGGFGTSNQLNACNGEAYKTQSEAIAQDKGSKYANDGSSAIGATGASSCQKQECNDMICFTYKKRRHYPVVCGQHPCVHPRYPTCVADQCFPMQCYRTGPDKPMICCLNVPYTSPPRREVFCHPISCDKGIPPVYPPCDYQFTYLE